MRTLRNVGGTIDQDTEGDEDKEELIAIHMYTMMDIDCTCHVKSKCQTNRYEYQVNHLKFRTKIYTSKVYDQNLLP
jgi:hypothetical protein